MTRPSYFPALMDHQDTAIGIDVSKRTLDIAIVSETKRKHEKVKNDLSGLAQLAEAIGQLRLPKDTVIVIEATGGYHYEAVFFLLDRGFTNVKVINPSVAKHFSRMQSVRGTKTDKIDAILLARLGKTKAFPSYRESREDIRKKQVVTVLTGLRESLRQARQRHGHFKQQARTIPCPELLDSLEAVIAPLKQEIRKLEKLLCTLAQADVQIISSIRGISEKGAAVISAQLGDISRFRNEKQVIAFSGLDPKCCESGTSVKGGGRISKKGNHILRCSLFQSAWYIYLQAGKGLGDKIFLDFVGRLKAKKLHYYQILCAIARKLLGVIYALLKKQEKFQENHYFSLTSV